MATLPRVTYLDANEATNPDLTTALRRAVENYQEPLGERTQYSNPWQRASLSWQAAGRFVAYAKQVAKESPPHREAPETRPLVVGQEVNGRFGNGDKLVPASISKDRAGWVADVFQLKLTSDTKVVFASSCTTCGLAIVIADSTGKRIADDLIEMKKNLKAGVYEVWVACFTGVGTYSLRADIQR